VVEATAWLKAAGRPSHGVADEPNEQHGHG
jgi:hypothetical protein